MHARGPGGEDLLFFSFLCLRLLLDGRGQGGVGGGDGGGFQGLGREEAPGDEGVVDEGFEHGHEGFAVVPQDFEHVLACETEAPWASHAREGEVKEGGWGGV